MTEPFGARLHAAMCSLGPLCAGIDPHASLLADWGLPDSARGLEEFGRRCIEAFAGRVAAVKPQSAFFERHGASGVAALERVVAEARGAGLLVVLDVKRGDIGSTSQAYAEAYLAAGAPLEADAVTLSPYLGLGSLDPFVDLARQQGRGLFVLALTSNPEGATVQRATTPDGRTVAGAVLAGLAQLNAGQEPLGSFGAVVGATIDPPGPDVDLAAVNGPLLAPGLGAQGGTVDDLRAVFGDALPAVLAASSRDLLRHGPDVAALAEAAEATATSLAALTA